MKRTSLYLLVTLFWMLALRSMLLAQGTPRVEHVQSMHQYIVREAYALLQREEPGLSTRLRDHIGRSESGDLPWELHTIMAGAWREDCEDVVYGFGGTDKSLWPAIEINTPGACIGLVYDDFKDEVLNAEELATGIATITHFWDREAQDNFVGKDGIAVTATSTLSCLSTPNQTVTIKVPVNAWDKMQKFYRPMGMAIRDYWWEEGDRMYDGNDNLVCVLPTQVNKTDALLISYNTLPALYNDGACAIQLPGETSWRNVVFTTRQRERYVWEIFGRMCHLLADMSVPAHAHKDMHMGNILIEKKVVRYGVHLGDVRIEIHDADSYENWVGNPVARWWTVDKIFSGLIDLSSVNDPLYHLMATMRDRAASFASDDFDGTGRYEGVPRYAVEIPDHYGLSGGQMGIIKHGLMCAVRDNTLPYAIRATATLMAWFAGQLRMDATYEVRNIGAVGYDDFFAREHFTDPFPFIGLASGTTFSKSVGDELSLRSHIEPHPQTDAKFRIWADKQHGMTTQHQFDDYVLEGQSRVEASYDLSFGTTTPTVRDLDERGMPLHAVFPTFRNPWQVDKREVTAWTVPQPEVFAEYRPQPSTADNGGLFLNCYDKNKPEQGYYSIRASRQLDGASGAQQSGTLEVGDHSFIGWEAIHADLYDDPQDACSPPHPAYDRPEQYDTKIVDFQAPTAIVNAHYKTHRTAVLRTPPTRSNSQRKVALDDGDTYHAVYESSNRVWYTKSTDHGVSWSGEMLVSDMGTQATRPSIAASGASAWICCVENGEVVLRVLTDRRWDAIYRAPVSMAAEATPAIAVLGEYEGCTAQGKVVCLVWEDSGVLSFAVLKGTQVLVDNQILVRGKQHPTSIDQPRYPSIAASTMPYVKQMFDHGFHIAWIENGSIFYCRLGVDRRSATLRLLGWMPGGTAMTETVHAKTGSVGAMYPARHAPSIGVTEEGTVHVGFDIVSSWSTWPHIGVNPGGIPAGYALRERAAPTLLGPTWQTTATIVSSGNTGADLCSPSLGVRPSAGVKGSKTASLRIAYNDRAGLINVAQLDGSMSIKVHEDGRDASLTAWSRSSDGLLDVFSDDAKAPYDWVLSASQNNLRKTTEGVLRQQRQILLRNGESFVALGFSDLRLTGDLGDEKSLVWDPAHDSLVVDVNCSVPDKMRTQIFLPAPGERLQFLMERFTQAAEDANAEVLLRITDTRTDEILRVVSWPLHAASPEQQFLTQTVDVSDFAGVPLRADVSMSMHGDDWKPAIVDRYAWVDVETAKEAEKSADIARAAKPVLHQNHPNPFNPSTTISFDLESNSDVRLRVYNLLGEQVAELVNSQLEIGSHAYTFDADALPTGVYIYRLDTGAHTLTRTMHLLK